MGEELAADASIAKFSDAEHPVRALGKSYVELQGLLGGDKVTLPKNGAPPEEWARVFDAMGRPEKPEGYDFSKLKPPEDLPWDETIALHMINSLHGAGANQQQIEKVIGDYIAIQHGQYQQFVERGRVAHNETVEMLQKEWGTDYEKNAAIAEMGFRALAGEHADEIGEVRLGDGSKFGSHPLLSALFYKVGAMLDEHGLLGDKAAGGGGAGAMSKADAIAELALLQGKEENRAILMDQSHAEHKVMQDKVTMLQKIAYGEEVT
jgi:hypothetical protein